MEKKNIAMQPKSRILFLIDLCEDIINKLKCKNFDYLSFLNTIRGFSHVDVYEEISAPFLGKAIDYSVVVLVAHQENGIVKLKDGEFSMHEMVKLIPKDTSSVIDIAICGSEIIEDEIISHCANALPITAVETTQIEFRIPLYSQLLSFEYLDKSNYEALFKEIQESMQAGLDLRTDKLGSFPSSTKLGTMSTSAAPPRVCRNSPFPVKVYIHADGDELDINAEIGDYRRNIKRNLKLKNGDSISWNLSFNTDPKPYEDINKHVLGAGLHSEIWNSEKPRIEYTFDCFVEPEFNLNAFNGVLKTTIGDKKPETWSFKFTVEIIPYKVGSSNNKSHEATLHTNESMTNDITETMVKHGKGYGEKHPKYPQIYIRSIKSEITTRIIGAMTKMIDQELIKNKQDWVALYQVLKEKEDECKKLSKVDFVKMLQNFPSRLVPASSSNLDKVAFTGEYPQWKKIQITTATNIDSQMSDGEIERLGQLAEVFLSFYQE